MHLLDQRFQGVAKGVGTAKILGRVHSAQIKVGSQFLHCSFTVMEGKDVDLLFGLDMLKRHLMYYFIGRKCRCIDLQKNVLRIQDEEVSFLPEHELPENARTPVVEATDSLPNEPGSSAPPKSGAPKPSATSSAEKSNKFPESAIKGLMDIGVSRAEAIAALEASEGDVDVAAGMLLG